MGALIARLFGWLTTLAAAQFGGSKALWMGILTSVVGVVLYNLGVEVFQEVMTWTTTQLSAVSVPGQPAGLGTQLTGLAGWFAEHLRIPECVSFIVSITVARWTIKAVAGLVPGLGGVGG